MFFPLHQRSDAERPIAAGRLLLAGASVLALGLAPPEPGPGGGLLLGVLLAYGLYAVAAAALAAAARVPRGPLVLASHGLDIAVGALLLGLTAGLASPFFPYLVFALLSGTLRWDGRGALWTGVAVFGVFTALALAGGSPSGGADGGIDHRLALTRAGHLSAATLLLAHLGGRLARLRGDAGRLASGLRPPSGDADEALRDALAHAAVTLGAPRAAVCWDDPEEPWLHLALWSAEGFERRREPPGRLDPPVAEPLLEADFCCPGPSRPRAEVTCRAPSGLARWRGEPLHPGLRAMLAPRSVLGLVLLGETFQGRLFALDKEGLGEDDLALGRAVARQVAAHLDQAHQVERLRRAAAWDERVRLARDLHDGVVQSLTAAALKVQAALGALGRRPEDVEARLREVQQILADEQRDLRAISRDLKPWASSPTVERDLARRLREVCERVEAHWGLRAVFQGSLNGLGAVPGSLAHETCRTLHEALVNAARHGRARIARVALAAGSPGYRLTVEDDGSGFSFRGAYELPELAARRMGPLALRERVAGLGGTLRVESHEGGARLEIGFPLPGRSG
ncbi:MAG: histidine kinase [Deferrisomatales bacterium]|nr:histidine kinase [Deferrisomatales bacterium]